MKMFLPSQPRNIADPSCWVFWTCCFSVQLPVKLFPQNRFPAGQKPPGLRCIDPKLCWQPQGMAERCPEHRAAAQNVLPSGSQVEHQSRARPPSKCGEQGREPATAATPSASQNIREGKKGGGCSQEKASNNRLRPGLAIAVHLSSEGDEIAAVSASAAVLVPALPRRLGQVCFLLQDLQRRRKRCWFLVSEQKLPMA